MIKILIAGLLFTGMLPAYGQRKSIKEAEVSRIIKTLSADDMQGRRTFTPGIEKASNFIQEEFRKAGLKPMPGLQTFSQSFSMYKVKPVSALVQLGGMRLPTENIIVSTGNEGISWKSGTILPEVLTISATENFVQAAGKLMAGEKAANQLILVNPAHAVIFARYKNYLGRSNLKTEKSNGATIMVLTDQSEAKNILVEVKNKVTEQKLNNVIGYLPGKKKPEEFVIFSGHYDHLGIIKEVNGDSIANGADDDAAGTTAVITLANYFKKKKNNARSLLFVAFTAEEIGGFGATYFSKQLDPGKIIAMFNIEMIGKESQFGKNAGFITGFDKSDLGKIVNQNLAGTGFVFHPDPYITENLFYRSDNATLARLGVPAHSFSTDKIDTDKLYHSVDDEFETLDMANMTAAIKAIAKGAESIIAGKDTPSRVAPEM